MISDLDRGYAAGLYEGEGTISVVTSSPSRFYIRVRMSDLEPIQRFQRIFPFATLSGPWTPIDRTPLGRKRKPLWCVATSSRGGVLKVLAALWSNLSPRRQEQATKAMSGFRMD